MTRHTPQIEAILEELTTLCCEALEADGQVDRDRIEGLTKSLSTNGWERHSSNDPPLSVTIESRVLERCKEPAMHRGASLSSLVEQIQAIYNANSEFEKVTPESPAS